MRNFYSWGGSTVMFIILLQFPRGYVWDRVFYNATQKVDQYLWGAYLCSKENNCATNKHSMPFNLRKVDLNRKTEAVSPLCQVQAVHSPWVLISSLRNTKLWGLKRIRGRKFSLTIRVFKCLDRLISCSLY